ncbi:MAG: MarR family transcriptional regulator [Alphaproteobacteria bacterium]|nr:MAG: MarR family transcriptional regulator [Alphaproteobacteria bacterium]
MASPAEDPERSFGFLLHDSARLLRRDFERRARALGLTRAQWAAIAHLRRQEGCNQSTLADLLDVEPITLARLLDRMEAAGLIERRPDPADRRARLVFLTAKAKPLIERLAEFAAETRQNALAGLSPEEQDRFVEALLRVRANLSRRAGETSTAAPPRGSMADDLLPPVARHG